MRTVLTILLLLVSVAGVDAQTQRQPDEQASADEQIWLIFPGRTVESLAADWMTDPTGAITGAGPRTAPRGNSAERLNFDRSLEVSANPQLLASEFKRFVSSLQSVFTAASSVTGDYAVDQIELNVSITAEGKLGIIVASGSYGAEAGLKVILRRVNPETE